MSSKIKKNHLVIFFLVIILFVNFPIMAVGTTLARSPNNKYAAIVIHEGSGEIIYGRNMNKLLHPASLTKIMTLYVLFDELDKGRLQLTSLLKTSRRAASQPPSKLGLRSGEFITVETAIEALIIKSANDVSVVVAENIAGNEYKFVKIMNKTAKKLAMSRTTFQNPHGLSTRYMRSTAKDLAVLTQRIIQDFPQYYKYFSERSFFYHGRRIYSHNHVLKNLSGAEGLKTGYTRLAGYNLVTTVNRHGQRLIGVVLGGKSYKSRDKHMKALISKAYKSNKTKRRLYSIAYAKPQNPMMKSGNLVISKRLRKNTKIASYNTNNSLTNSKRFLQSNNDTIAGKINNDIEVTLAEKVNNLDKQVQNFNKKDYAINLIDPDRISYILASKVSNNEKINIGEGDFETVSKDQGSKDVVYFVQIGAFSNIRKANSELSRAIKITSSNRAYINTFDNKIGKKLYRPRILVRNFKQGNKICKQLAQYQLSCFVSQK